MLHAAGADVGEFFASASISLRAIVLT